MRREDLHHVVAAAAQTVGESDFVVVGSQSILGSYPDANRERDWVFANDAMAAGSSRRTSYWSASTICLWIRSCSRQSPCS
jgi:hypothetical protein